MRRIKSAQNKSSDPKQWIQIEIHKGCFCVTCKSDHRGWSKRMNEPLNPSIFDAKEMCAENNIGIKVIYKFLQKDHINTPIIP